jgi:hypothetical protein
MVTLAQALPAHRLVRRLCLVAAAVPIIATVAAASTTTPVAASSAYVGAVGCPGPVTWTFSSPLSLAFTPSGTVTQSWGAGSACAGAGAFASSGVQWPLPDWEVTQVSSSPFTGTAGFSGSCTVANVGVSAFGAPGQQGVLVGGSVFVSPPFSPGPGAEFVEVDVLAPLTPCNETTASGVGVDVAVYDGVSP